MDSLTAIMFRRLVRASPGSCMSAVCLLWSANSRYTTYSLLVSTSVEVPWLHHVV